MKTTEEIKKFLQLKIVRYDNEIKLLKKYQEEKPHSTLNDAHLAVLITKRKELFKTYNEIFN